MLDLAFERTREPSTPEPGPRRRRAHRDAGRAGAIRHTGLLLIVLAAGCKSPPEYDKKVHPPLMAAPPATKTSTPAVARPAKPVSCKPADLAPATQRVQSAPGVEVLVTHVDTPLPRRGAVVLMHGAGSPSSSIWDLHVDDYSVMRRLACEGFDVYGVDVRGFGGSSPPPLDKSGKPAAVRAADVQVDLDAAVQLAKRRSKVETVDLVGWSWGCVVSGMYAGLHPEHVRRLVLFAPVYDRRWKTRHARRSKWKPVGREAFFEYHDPERERRDVLERHVEALFRYAGEDGTLRLSNGPYFDIYGKDAPIWDPAKVRAPTLVLRGDQDRASQAEPAKRLFMALKNTATRRSVVIRGAGHFAFRTKKYREFQDEVVRFLTSSVIKP